MKKVVLLALVSLFLFLMLVVMCFAVSVKAEPRTWTVDDDGPADFSKIKDAINAASPGDTIFVKAGIYNESGITLKDNLSLIGENKYNTTIDGRGLGKILIIMTIHGVTISGFTIQNSPIGTAGIWLEFSTKNNIVNNVIENHDSGVYSFHSNSNLIEGNMVANNNEGIILSTGCRENKIKGNNVTGNTHPIIGGGIDLTNGARDNEVENNNIIQNKYGIIISHEDNSIFGNQIIENDVGIYEYLEPTRGYKIFHNNFINNAKQVALGNSSVDTWDNGVEGNYWSDYNGTDFNQDGIGNIPYVINANNADRYPLMGMFHSFNTIPRLRVNIISNSSISDFEYSKSNSTIKIQVSNMTANQTFGFCRICIPHALMYEPYNVTIDGANPVFWNYTLYDNGTHRWIYFVYQHSTHKVVIQGSDTAPPIIPILSPENKTYPLNEIPLTFTVDEPTDWMGYSLDGQTNVTIAGNTTLPSLFDGSHYVVVYANDTAGNMGFSTVYFTIDTTPPDITDVSQIPLENNVLSEDRVKVNATVIDGLSKVKQVTLNYTNGNGTWVPVNMTNLEGNIWNATIPAFPYCTNVTYIVIAEDNVGNIITTEDMEYEYQYHVIPEFPTWTSLLLILIVLTVAVAVYKRKLLKTLTH